MGYHSKVELRRRSIPVRGIDYSICEWGTPGAPLIVYLHGWADTASTFQFVVDSLRAEWFIVAPDWRGFGRTEHAPSSYWFPDYVADLHHIIELYAADNAVSLVGHSMGGNVATIYAGTMPERVAALVNLEGFGLKDSDPNDAPQRYRDWIEKSIAGQRYSKYASFEALAKKIIKRSPGLTAAQADFVAREWAQRSGDGTVRLRADAKHKLPNPILYRRAEIAACARQITAKTLLISGGDSPFGQGAKTQRALAPTSSETRVIDGVGHMLHYEAAQPVAAAIEAHFSKTL